MHCQQFEERINALLDARQAPESDSLLGAHAASCESCRQLLAAHRAIFAGLADPVVPLSDRNFARRVVALAAVNEPTAAPRRRSPVLVACLVSAAALLVGISLLLSGGSRVDRVINSPTAAPRLVVKSKRTAGRLAIINPGSRLPGGQPGDRAAITGGDLLLEAPRLPQHLVTYRGAMNEMAVNLPNAAQRLDEVEEIVPGIRPLRDSFSMIWDTLVRSLPAPQGGQPPPDRGAASPPGAVPIV